MHRETGTIFFRDDAGNVQAIVTDPSNAAQWQQDVPKGAELIMTVWTTDIDNAWHTYRSLKGEN